VLSLAAILGYSMDYQAKRGAWWLGGLLLVANLCALVVPAMFGLSWIQRHMKSDVSSFVQRVYAGAIVWTVPLSLGFWLLTHFGIESTPVLIAAPVALQTAVMSSFDPEITNFIVQKVASDRVRAAAWAVALLLLRSVREFGASHSFRCFLLLLGLLLASEHDIHRKILDNGKLYRVLGSFAALLCSLLTAVVTSTGSADDSLDIAATAITLIAATIFMANTSGFHPWLSALVNTVLVCVGGVTC
jgi:hypothetical protein